MEKVHGHHGNRCAGVYCKIVHLVRVKDGGCESSTCDELHGHLPSWCCGSPTAQRGLAGRRDINACMRCTTVAVCQSGAQCVSPFPAPCVCGRVENLGWFVPRPEGCDAGWGMPVGTPRSLRMWPKMILYVPCFTLRCYGDCSAAIAMQVSYTHTHTQSFVGP